MQKYTVRKYLPTDAAQWNEFLLTAKNATFLFNRNYMEYHSDRFEDYSLMVFDKNKLIAILPANKEADVIYSHKGLTYGGIVYGSDIKLSGVILVLRDILKFLSDSGFKLLNIKLIPSIYWDTLADETAYALFVCGASLYRRDNLSVIDRQKPFKFSKDRIKCARRGERNKLQIREEPEFEAFWKKILIPNMNRKHGVKPVHTIEEITKLHQRFPENIRHFNVYHNDKIIAGTTIFLSKNVAHPQNISANELKNETGSLDYLYSHLIHDVFRDIKYFDFGPSTEQNGTKMNSGLLFWKESFGARTATQDFYTVETANYNLLENMML